MSAKHKLVGAGILTNEQGTRIRVIHLEQERKPGSEHEASTHLHDLYNGEVALDLHTDWPCLLVIAGIVALTGPLVFLAFAIQNWCASSCWDYEDRWQGTRAFAVSFIVIALLLVLFRGFFLQIWLHTLGALFWYPVF